MILLVVGVLVLIFQRAGAARDTADSLRVNPHGKTTSPGAAALAGSVVLVIGLGLVIVATVNP